MTSSPGEQLFRSAALAAYRSGVGNRPPETPERPPRWPILGLAVLAVLAAAFATVFHVPTFVRAAPLTVDGASVVALVAGPTLPQTGQPAGLRLSDRAEMPLEVVDVAKLTDRGGARRWGLPAGAPLPATVVRLATVRPGDRPALNGTVQIRVANPTLLGRLLPGTGGR